jgi:hypothetical protein
MQRSLVARSFAAVIVAFGLFAAPATTLAQSVQGTVVDGSGKKIGALAGYDRMRPKEWPARYAFSGRENSIVIVVKKTAIESRVRPGHGNALFTTPDCSGNDMFALVKFPGLANRRGIVLPRGPAGKLDTEATSAWLWVSGPNPALVVPGTGTVFHSEWTDHGTCSAFATPGHTVTSGPGGYWVHPVADLLAKFKRPFKVEYTEPPH